MDRFRFPYKDDPSIKVRFTPGKCNTEQIRHLFTLARWFDRIVPFEMDPTTVEDIATHRLKMAKNMLDAPILEGYLSNADKNELNKLVEEALKESARIVTSYSERSASFTMPHTPGLISDALEEIIIEKAIECGCGAK